MKTSLYEISERYNAALTDMIENDVDEKTMLDTLDSIEGELEVKCTNVAAFFQNIDAQVEAMHHAEKRIQVRRRYLENKSERLREYLLTNMVRCGISKVESPEFQIGIGKCPPSVDVFDEEAVPDIYKKPKLTPVKDWIKKAIENGVDVPGARLVTEKKRLTIK